MKFEITKFCRTNADIGFIALFDVSIEDTILLRNLTLVHPEKRQGFTWVYYPELALGKGLAFTMRDGLRRRIGGRATARYIAETGRRLVHEPRKHDAANDNDDAGVRRTLGAVEETMRMAGL